MTIAFTPNGQLTADGGTLARLRQIVAEDAAELGVDPPPGVSTLAADAKSETGEDAELARPPKHKERIVRVAPPADDRAIESLLTGLMAMVYVEAQRSLDDARKMDIPGQPVELRSLAVHEAYRLCKVMAMLTAALAKHRGRAQRLVIEHHVYRDV
jgi:hypothetical protein